MEVFMASIISTVVAIVSWLTVNYQLLISAVAGLVTVLISLALVIPGKQPEALLQKFVDFITKFSKK